MKRNIFSIITIVIALILLFLLIRTLVHAFTGKPKVTAPIKTTVTTSQPTSPHPEKPAYTAPTNPTPVSNPAPATTAPTTATGTNPATGTSTTGTTGTKLSNTGPADVLTGFVAAGATVGTVLIVRRRQLANL